MERNRVFISYSHRDQQGMERLRLQLAPLEQEGRLDLWVDGEGDGTGGREEKGEESEVEGTHQVSSRKGRAGGLCVLALGPGTPRTRGVWSETVFPHGTSSGCLFTP